MVAIGVALYNVALIVFIALHLAVGGAVRHDISKLSLIRKQGDHASVAKV